MLIFFYKKYYNSTQTVLKSLKNYDIFKN